MTRGGGCQRRGGGPGSGVVQRVHTWRSARRTAGTFTRTPAFPLKKMNKKFVKLDDTHIISSTEKRLHFGGINFAKDFSLSKSGRISFF